MTWALALEKSNALYGPELYLKEQKAGKFYNNHPLLSRFIFVPLGSISAIFKVFLFPIISALGLILMPLKAAYDFFINKDNNSALASLKATAFCFLGVSASLTFLAVTGFYVPINWSALMFVSFTVISISFHVYKMAKAPPLAVEERL